MLGIGLDNSLTVRMTQHKNVMLRSNELWSWKGRLPLFKIMNISSRSSFVFTPDKASETEEELLTENQDVKNKMSSWKERYRFFILSHLGMSCVIKPNKYFSPFYYELWTICTDKMPKWIQSVPIWHRQKWHI